MVHFYSDNRHNYLDNVLRAIFINLRMMAVEAVDVLSNEFDKATSRSLTKVIFYLYIFYTYLWPFSKSKLNLKSDRVNLVAPALVLLSVCFIYPMSGQNSTNWNQKGWPGSEIQKYYGCPWLNNWPFFNVSCL